MPDAVESRGGQHCRAGAVGQTSWPLQQRTHAPEQMLGCSPLALLLAAAAGTAAVPCIVAAVHA